MTELQLHKWVRYFNFSRHQLDLYPIEYIGYAGVWTLCCNLNGEPDCLISLWGQPNLLLLCPCDNPPSLVVLSHSRVVVTPQGVYTLDQYSHYRKQT